MLDLALRYGGRGRCTQVAKAKVKSKGTTASGARACEAEAKGILSIVRKRKTQPYTVEERIEVLEYVRDISLERWASVVSADDRTGIITFTNSYRDACEELSKITGTGGASGSVNMYFDGVALDRLDFGPGKKKGE